VKKFEVVRGALSNKDPKQTQYKKHKKPTSMLEWFHILRNIKDEDLRAITGTDYALYLMFQRYAAKLFAAITILNFIIFIPIYASGHPRDLKEIEDKDGNI